MKQLLAGLTLVLCTLSVYTQSYVFVLVDVSTSIKLNELTDAKQALNEVLTGSPLTKAFVTQGKLQDLINFKLIKGDYLSISKFGSVQTTLSISPNPVQIQNVAVDVNQIINSIAWIPNDGQTYYILAKAKIAEYAKNHQIAKYKLYIISDNVQDDYGPNGKPNYPDDYTRNLAEGYNTSNNQVSESGFTKIKFSTTALFTLSFSPAVDISKYSLPPGGGIIPAIIDSVASITIITPQKGSKNKEIVLNSDNLIVQWSCPNCPQGTKFSVIVSEYDGGKFREIKKELLSNSASFKVPDGKFKITVSATNYPLAASDTTFVKVNTGSYGWLVLLLVCIVAAGTSYYFWNKKRQEKIDVFTSNISDDIFSDGSNKKSSANTSSNSDYF